MVILVPTGYDVTGHTSGRVESGLNRDMVGLLNIRVIFVTMAAVSTMIILINLLGKNSDNLVVRKQRRKYDPFTHISIQSLGITYIQ